jgi:hypothetical protein
VLRREARQATTPAGGAGEGASGNGQEAQEVRAKGASGDGQEAQEVRARGVARGVGERCRTCRRCCTSRWHICPPFTVPRLNAPGPEAKTICSSRLPHAVCFLLQVFDDVLEGHVRAAATSEVHIAQHRGDDE